MFNKLNLVSKIAIAIGIILVVYIAYYITTTTAVVIQPSSESWVKTGLFATTSRDGHKKLHQLPYKVRLKNGSYSITAWGEGSAVETREIVVESKPQTVEITFKESSGEDIQKLYGIQPSLNPYLEYFPATTAEYELRAEYSVDEQGVFSISSYSLLVSHRFYSSSDGEPYALEREAAVDSAKKWLVSRSLPVDLPITITENQ